MDKQSIRNQYQKMQGLLADADRKRRELDADKTRTEEYRKEEFSKYFSGLGWEAERSTLRGMLEAAEGEARERRVAAAAERMADAGYQACVGRALQSVDSDEIDPLTLEAVARAFGADPVARAEISKAAAAHGHSVPFSKDPYDSDLRALASMAASIECISSWNVANDMDTVALRVGGNIEYLDREDTLSSL